MTKTQQTGWRSVSIKDLGKVVAGKTPSKMNPEYWGNLLDFITPTDFKNDSKFLPIVSRKLSEEGAAAFVRLRIPKKSILVTCIGSDMGKVAICENESVTNQQINSIIINNNFDADFVYYLLKDSYEMLRVHAEGGSTMPIINKSQFENLTLSLPPLPEQRSVAAVLSSFDDKIELLRKQNKTLEEMAQALFKEWFVDFNFPNEKGKPYKTSGGKMVESELGEVPEGWGVGSILDIADLIGGGTPKTSFEEYWNGNIKWLSAKDVSANSDVFILDSEKKITDKGLLNSSTKLLPEFSTIITARGTVGALCIIPERMCMSQSNYAIKSRNNNDYFVYLLISSLINHLQAAAYGAVFDTITTSTFQNSHIALPSDELILDFENVVKPMFGKLLNNNQQIQTLSSLRDKLLPRLMRGNVNFNT